MVAGAELFEPDVADVVPDDEVDDWVVVVVVDARVELEPADDEAAMLGELAADWAARTPTMPENTSAASPVVTRRARAAG